LYGDATKADEIVARNRVIRNPVAVPGGVDLEVLADA
jgi:prophage DNA circulation protein